MFRTLGRAVLHSFASTSEVLGLLREVLRSLIYERGAGRRVVRRTRVAQVYFTAVQAVPLVVLLGFLLGFTSVLAAGSVGVTQITAFLLSILVLDLGPIVTAFIVLGRSGGAVAVEVGNMVVAREIEGLEILGINPVRHVVWPRLVGVSFATGCLSVVMSASLVISGAFATSQDFGGYFREVLGTLTPADVFFPPIKAFVFGVFIALIACNVGFRIQPFMTEVPKAAIRVFIRSTAACAILNVLLVGIYYWWRS